MITIYTDGSAVNRKGVDNTGHGGIGIVLNYQGDQVTHGIGRFVNTTSARMEIAAIIAALEMCDPGHHITIFTDNKYCSSTISSKWYDKWLDHKQDKKNLDLWSRFRKIHTHHVAHGSTVEVRWVKGHAGNELNCLADKLAGDARIKSKTIITDDRRGIADLLVQ